MAKSIMSWRRTAGVGVAAAAVCMYVLDSGVSVAHGMARRDEVVYELKKAARLSQLSDGIYRITRKVTFGANAHDGDPWWYLVRLRLRVEIGGAPRRSPVELTASVNDLTENQIELERRRLTGCQGVGVSWKSIDLLRGYVDRVSCDPGVTLKSENFTQLRAIRRGESTFAVQAKGRLGENGSVTVLPGSGILRSRRGPARLVFAPIHSNADFPVGSWREVPCELVNRGDRVAEHVHVQVDTDSGLAWRWSSDKVPMRVGPHRRVSGSLWVKPMRPGQFALRLFATSTANHPGVEVLVRTGTETNSSSGRTRGTAAIVAIGGLLTLVLLWRNGRVGDGTGRRGFGRAP